MRNRILSTFIWIGILVILIYWFLLEQSNQVIMFFTFTAIMGAVLKIGINIWLIIELCIKEDRLDY